MNFKLIPLKEIRKEITLQPDPALAFKNILAAAKKNCPRLAWGQFSDKYLKKDITAATNWIQQTLDKKPKAKGIYLGLDTLNMNKGKGSNVEIGLNTKCDPAILSDEWIFDCDHYGESHLIKGLYLFFKNFIGPDKDNKDLAEYTIFLAYSGLVLREALLQVETKRDLIACWGFHDGDIFLLMNRIGQKNTVLANKRKDIN